MADLAELLRLQNRLMIAFDLALGAGTLLAPAKTLRVLGHDEPSAVTEAMFRRQAPVWLTFALAHAVAEARGEPRDWWAVAWLRGTEVATDALWSRSPAFTRPGARAGLLFAAAQNAGMTLGFAWLATRRGRGRR